MGTDQAAPARSGQHVRQEESGGCLESSDANHTLFFKGSMYGAAQRTW